MEENVANVFGLYLFATSLIRPGSKEDLQHRFTPLSCRSSLSVFASGRTPNICRVWSVVTETRPGPSQTKLGAEAVTAMTQMILRLCSSSRFMLSNFCKSSKLELCAGILVLVMQFRVALASVLPVSVARSRPGPNHV